MTRYTGINHLALVCGDMDETVRFWRDLLGLRLVGGLGRPGYRQYFFEISKDDLISFFEWPGVFPAEEKDHGYPVAGPVIFDHVALGVDTEEDLWEIKDKLDASGFETSEVVDHGFILSVYAFDPNGIPIEFSLLNRERDLRKNPVLVDSEPGKAAMEGPCPQPNQWPVYTSTPKRLRRRYPGDGAQLFVSAEK